MLFNYLEITAFSCLETCQHSEQRDEPSNFLPFLLGDEVSSLKYTSLKLREDVFFLFNKECGWYKNAGVLANLVRVNRKAEAEEKVYLVEEGR